MDVTQQRYMIALAETGSITEAARSLGVSQPAISSWLKNLEAQLGRKLVIRSKKGMVLTPAGNAYLEGARRMVEVRNDTYRAISRILGTAEETVVMAGTPSGGARTFSRIFRIFKTDHPQVKLRFVEAYNSQAFDLVRSGEADIALCSCLDEGPEDLACIPLHSRELILAVPRDFPMGYDASDVKQGAELPAIDPCSLRDLPFVMPSPEMSYYEGLTQIFRKVGFRPNVIFQSASTQMVYNMFREGNAAGIVPRTSFSPLDKVSPFSLEPRLISRAVVVTRKGNRTPALEAAVECMIQDGQRR